MPLGSRSFWLDWDSAVSIVGHDIEVKETYETLLRSKLGKPELFIDIGANYGTHSLLFLVHKVRTISFEPNSECQKTFRAMCDLNRVTPTIEAVALGARPGFTEIAYPERDTWLGSTHPQTIERLSRSDDLIRRKVIQKTLDDYLPLMAKRNTLIKIDTEGNELAVLQGGVGVLQSARPVLIFESHRDESRSPIYDFLVSQRYSVSTLPYNPLREFRPFTREQFASHHATNFVSRPA
jgi:FkbM family methyltransferase